MTVVHPVSQKGWAREKRKLHEYEDKARARDEAILTSLADTAAATENTLFQHNLQGMMDSLSMLKERLFDAEEKLDDMKSDEEKHPQRRIRRHELRIKVIEDEIAALNKSIETYSSRNKKDRIVSNGSDGSQEGGVKFVVRSNGVK